MMNAHNRFHALLVVLTLLGLPLAACGPAPAAKTSGELEGTITISGAFALYPMMTRWGEEFQKLNPKVQFNISAGGAGKGMSDALAGAVDIGMVSRSITPEEEANGAFWVAVTKDAVFPTINANNPVLQDLLARGIPRATFIKMYITGEIKTWGEVVGKPEITDEIHVYTRSDACGAADAWAKFLGGTQEDLLGVAVFGDPGLLDAVVKDPLGIGFNNLNYAFDITTGKPVAGAMIPPIDVNENGKADTDELLETNTKAMEVVKNGKYPSPPARLENLVTKGKPAGLVLAFIQWILNDGQKFLDEAGYVPLPQEQINQAIQKLK
jgi:phosphate transport system substrate-binding protein